MATLLQRLKRNLLCIHQYKVRILYESGSQLYIADWLSMHNHNEGKDEEMVGMNLNIYAIETCTDFPE